jgi:hypothetical protein
MRVTAATFHADKLLANSLTPLNMCCHPSRAIHRNHRWSRRRGQKRQRGTTVNDGWMGEMLCSLLKALGDWSSAYGHVGHRGDISRRQVARKRDRAAEHALSSPASSAIHTNNRLSWRRGTEGRVAEVAQPCATSDNMQDIARKLKRIGGRRTCMLVTAATFHKDKSLVNELARKNICCRRRKKGITHEPLAEQAARARRAYGAQLWMAVDCACCRVHSQKRWAVEATRTSRQVTAAIFQLDKSLVNELAPSNMLCHCSEPCNTHEPSAEQAARVGHIEVAHVWRTVWCA